MAFRVIGKNAAIFVKIGGPQDGSAPQYGNAISIVALAKTIKREDSSTMTDLSAIGDDFDVMQFVRGGGKLTFDLEIEETGPQFEGALGYYAQVSIKSNSSLANPSVFSGVVSGYSQDFPEGAQTESVTITLGANGG